MKWIFSIASSLLIFGTSAGFILYLHKDIPTQLNNTSILVPSSSKVAMKTSKKELKDIIHEAQKEVVMIELDNGTLGSGFLYNKKGDVITNAHVANGAKKVRIKTSDAREFEGTVIGISKDVDVAVIRVSGMVNDTPLKIKKKKAEVGDEVLALGSPLGLQNTVTTGIVSGLNRDLDIAPFHYSKVYQISAPIAPGNSGGPLINSKTGEVIGINSAGTNQGAIGFSIPIVDILSLVEGWSSSPMTTLPTLSTDQSEEGGANTEATAKDSPDVTAEYLVKYFYESLNSSDFVTAYSLLGSSWQKNLDFTKFRNGYLNTRSNSLDEIQALQDGEICTVTAILTAEELKNGDYIYSKYKIEYTVGYENDQLKILSGIGKKIQ